MTSKMPTQESKSWRRVKLTDAVDINPKRPLVRGSRCKFVGMPDLKEWERKIQHHELREFTGGGAKFKNGDTLLARITPSLENGKTAFVDILDKGETAFGSTEFIVFSAKERTAEPLFVYYMCRSDVIRRPAIQSMTGTSGRQRVQEDVFNHIEIDLPPLDEQRAIAAILGALDDKIELNRRMNETLEAIARAVFKSWFIDFDPVKAKAEGRKPEGMHKETAALFPREFENSSLGKIPKGWTVARIEDVAEVIDCLHSKKPARRTEGKLLIQLWNIRDDGLIDLTDPYWISPTDYGQWINRIEASPGDIIITNVGRVAATEQIPVGLYAALGRNMTAIRHRSTFKYPTFLLDCLRSEKMKEEIKAKTDVGTILDALNVRNIPKLRFVRPPDGLVVQFENMCRCLRGKMEQNLFENATLSACRDSLLPKLISGEIRVEGVEKSLEVPA